MPPPMSPPPKMNLPNIRHVLAVASGKGGVGKSTVAANLALALQNRGLAIGLMDADIYGPSMPKMFGLGLIDQTQTPFPVERFGIRLMSMGFLIDPNQAVIWRGPKVAQAVSQFLGQVPWGNLDVLVIDLPPGTGDAQLTLAQSAPLTGAIIVTQPQEVSLIDARKGVRMFEEVKVPVLGIIENMSYFMGDDGKRYEIFRSGGGRRLADELGVAFLGELPLDPLVSECGDAGEPIVRKNPNHPVSRAFLELAAVTVERLGSQRSEDLPEVLL